MLPAALLEPERTTRLTALGLPSGVALVVLANASWDSTSRINCHHVAARAAGVHRVLFVESIGARVPSLGSGRDLRKVWRRFRSALRGLKTCSPNLAVLSPLLVPGFGRAGIDSLNARILEHQIRRAVAEWLNDSPFVLWIFTPAFAPVAARLGPALSVYQCVDEHAAYPGVPSEYMHALEEELIQRSDVTLTTSGPLFESRRARRSNVFCLPNVADTELFEQAHSADLEIPRDLERYSRPIVGFIGNISGFKVDATLLRRVADSNPGVTFLLIGEVGLGESNTSLRSIERCRNVHLLGPRRYEDLPGYLKGFDACMIPFAFNRVTEHCLPMKLFEYMASGKPIVATATRPLLEYAEHCYLAEDAPGFSAALHRALEEPQSGDRARARIQLSRSHGWVDRMTQLGHILEGAWDRRTVKGSR